ncbi:MAG: hypothetical protein GPJ54_10000 [Candidatus Heimdallarchaeota archaeon]|nr:hypothetical protein [Candidatus Heimdallarchaeota archaeon]
MSIVKMDRIKSSLAIKQVIENTAIRKARTCYDHLAGVAGVEIFEGLIDHNWLTLTIKAKRNQYTLTPKGIQAFKQRNIKLEKLKQTKRMIAYGCPDWTEQGEHLGGALGYLLLDSLESTNFISRSKGRVVDVLKPVKLWFEE